MDRRPHRVALTGGIATGKSYVAIRLREAGIPVVDADVLARQAVAPGSKALDQIRRRFGSGVITDQGELDRRKMADIVFRDESARRDLEAIVHPIVREGVERFFNGLPGTAAFAVADIPLLYESNRAGDFEAIVVAVSPRPVQVMRAMERDGATREEAERRIDAQWPIEEKAARADYVIRTDGTFAETDEAVAALIGALEERFRPAATDARS